MNWHLVGDELERICRNELLQRWPECEIIETKYDSVHGIDFAVRLRNGGIAIVEVKSAFGSVHGQQMTASWIADRLSPLLESAIINAFSWGAPVFRATYRVFAEKGVIRSATPTGSLTWAELFPNKPHPIKATDFSFSHGQAFIDGTYIKITHYYKNNITKQNHEYMINLEILSKAFVDSTLEFKTFPFELPHSHRIVENGVETYFRPLHQWISHLDSKLGLLDSKVGRETCRKCRITFFDNSN